MKRPKIILLLLLCLLIFTGCTGNNNEFLEKYNLASNNLLDGDYEQAILNFLSAIDLDDKNVDAYIGLFQAYMKNGQEEEANILLKDIEDRFEIDSNLLSLSSSDGKFKILVDDYSNITIEAYSNDQIISDTYNSDNSITFSNMHTKINSNQLDVTFYCDSIKANKLGEFSEWGMSVYENGSELITVKDTGTTWVEDHLYVNFNSKKYRINLKENKNYSFKFYVVFDGKIYWSNSSTYKTTSKAVAEQAASAPVSFSNQYASQNGDDPTNVTFYCDTIKANKMGEFSEWGVTIYENGSILTTVKDTGTTWVEDHLYVNFNSKKYGINLKEDTNYSFVFYVVFDNATYQGSSSSYRTASKPKVEEASISFSNQYVSQNGDDPTNVTFYCDTIKANKMGEFSEWGMTVYENGSELTTVKDTGTTWVENHLYVNFNSKKYGISLKEDKNYSYKFYVVFDGNTYWSNSSNYKTASKPKVEETSVSFSNQYASQNGDDPTNVTFYCDSINANKLGEFSEWGMTVYENGSAIATVKDTGTTWVEDHLYVNFNSKKYGINLKENTGYSYKFYVVFDGNTYWGSSSSYTTKEREIQQETPPSPPEQPSVSVSVSISNQYASQNGDDPTNVTFYCDSINANKLGEFSEWGMTVYENGSELITVKDTGTTWVEDHLYVNFNSKKYGINLNGATNYQYRFYVIFDGQVFYGETSSYTTN